MSAQQMKEGPASRLRAMFAGLGSMLSGKSKSEAKPAQEPAAPAAAAEKPSVAETSNVNVLPVTPATAATPGATATPETAEAAETAAASETAEAPAPAEAEAAAPAEAEPEAEVLVVGTETVVLGSDGAVEEVEVEVVALPLANYDQATLASLRARLRNLSVGQLTQLLDYERANAARPDVITMFERRIAKVQAEA